MLRQDGGELVEQRVRTLPFVSSDVFQSKKKEGQNGQRERKAGGRTRYREYSFPHVAHAKLDFVGGRSAGDILGVEGKVEVTILLLPFHPAYTMLVLRRPPIRLQHAFSTTSPKPSERSTQKPHPAFARINKDRQRRHEKVIIDTEAEEDRSPFSKLTESYNGKVFSLLFFSCLGKPCSTYCLCIF